MYFIYQISIEGTDHIYVGSTTNYNKRIYEHKRNILNMGLEYKLYQKMREHGLEKCRFSLIEAIECNKNDALKKEQQWIDTKCADLNETKSCNPTLPRIIHREYYENNKTKIMEKNKQYVEKNKEHISSYKKEWYEKNKARILEERKKAYHEKKSTPSI